MKQIKVKLHVIDDESVNVIFEGKSMREIKKEYKYMMDEAKYCVARGTVTEAQYKNIMVNLYNVTC